MNEPNPQDVHHPPNADHGAHTATQAPHPVKKNLWQRWMAWSGSFLVLSILAHVILLGGATVMVVQVVQGRKEKMKFTAPPPSAGPSAEHKVKPSKKTTAAVPAVSKRITSSAANASIALPALDMNSSTGPDVMASVMSGLGSSGLGSGAAGMAAMPVTGLSAFGFKGLSAGLRGNLWDLKQTADRKPSLLADKKAPPNEQHFKILDEYFSKDWDDKVLDQFYKAKDAMVTFQVYIPILDAREAPKAFGVENEVKPSHWVIVYKGSVTAPRDGTFRFIGYADDVMAVRFNKQNVFYEAIGTTKECSQKYMVEKYFKPTIPPDIAKKGQQDPNSAGYKEAVGNWFTVEAGKTYPMELLISEVPGGSFYAYLQIEERHPEKPYPKRTIPRFENFSAYPLFSLKKGVPVTPRKVAGDNDFPAGKNLETAPELAPESVIFQGK
jgi:hypothetical protein